MRRRAAVAGGIALAALALGGCGRPSVAEWNEVDHARAAELVRDEWLDGASGETSTHRQDLWVRPSAGRRGEITAPSWRVAADEAAAAELAGWEVVFVRCTSAADDVVVDLVRTLTDGSPATARITVGRAPGHRDVQVQGVALHHSDGAWVAPVPDGAPAGFDAGVCLDPPPDGIDPRWSGVPVQLSSSGGPVPIDAP